MATTELNLTNSRGEELSGSSFWRSSCWSRGVGQDRSASESSQLGTKSSKSFLKTQIELNEKSFVIYLSFAVAARAAAAAVAASTAAA